MQRRERQYTPTRSSALLNNSYIPQNRQGNKELTIAREYEALKLQARQLEISNRQLTSEAEKLKYQKSMNQSKLLQKANFQQQAMSQFQKEKNYQIDMIKVKNEEDLNRLRREYQKRIEESKRQLASRDLLGKQLNQSYGFLQSKAQQARGRLENYEMELMKLRDNNSSLTEQVTRQEFGNKKLEMLAEELETQRNQMEEEIHCLLDIESEKTRTIGSLEVQLGQSENQVTNLNQKLSLLTDNFVSLQEHISVMKERLLNAQMRGQDLEKELQSTELNINDRDQMLLQQRERERHLRDEIEGHHSRQSQRIIDVKQLIGDNERIYGDLNAIRFRLYDVSIQQGMDI